MPASAVCLRRDPVETLQKFRITKAAHGSHQRRRFHFCALIRENARCKLAKPILQICKPYARQLLKISTGSTHLVRAMAADTLV